MTRSAASLILLAVCLPAAAATHTVNVGPGLSFTPSTLTIVAGDSVRFTNKGGLHNVKADDNSFRCARGCDGDGSGGDGAPSSAIWTFTLTFATPGTVGYYCETHGAPGTGMAGSIVVQVPTPVVLQSFGVD